MGQNSAMIALHPEYVTTPTGARVVQVPEDEWRTVTALAEAADPAARTAVMVQLFRNGEGMSLYHIGLLFGITRLEVADLLGKAGVDAYPITPQELDRQLDDLKAWRRQSA
jgi:hypothetical protein